MGFKDQLLKAGLVSKKQVRKVNQKSRKDRKAKQSTREAKGVVEARTKAERRAERKRLQAEKLAARRERDRVREAAEAKRRVDQILQSHRVRFRGGQQRFWHHAPDGRHVGRLDLPASLAFDLHCGRLAIAYRGPADAFEPDVLLIPSEVADRVEKLDPSRVLFRNPSRPKEPEEALWTIPT